MGAGQVRCDAGSIAAAVGSLQQAADGVEKQKSLMLCLILSLAEKICKVFMVTLALVGTKDYN